MSATLRPSGKFFRKFLWDSILKQELKSWLDLSQKNDVFELNKLSIELSKFLAVYYKF